MDRRIYIISILLACGLSINAQEVDSINTAVAPEYDEVSKLHRFFLGESYRKLYNTPVRMRVLNLATEKGGLSIVKLGGGMQTQSLRLVDSTGREYVLRSIQKYPERSLSEALRKTIVKDIVQDQVSIVHPFGALTVPVFNQALDIIAAQPELVYVGDDPQLGEYSDIFKNRAYIFEPRMPEADVDTDNTEKVIRKVLADNDVSVDQKATLTARLLDMVLGDWDRHEDNWRWLPAKEKGETHYTPVPRDRDKVYYNTSGVFPVLLSYQYLKANVQPFKSSIRNVAEWNYNARHFDRLFLNELDAKDWAKAVHKLQNKLSNKVVDEAMLAFPNTIQPLSAPVLTPLIKARRDSLLSTALNYYQSLSKVVDIPLSQKNEFINIQYLLDKGLEVVIYNKKKDGSQGRKLYKRTFLPSETQEIRIYGISGFDEYKINASISSPIKLRIIGGDGHDVYKSDLPIDKGNALYVYDTKNLADNSIQLSGAVKYKLENDSSIHTYDYSNYVYDRKGILVDLNYGVDRGLILGVGYLIEKQGFRKEPFASRHRFMAHYLTGRHSFMFDYLGEFKKAIAKQDLVLQLNALGPMNQSNFFGYGNETIYEKEDTPDDMDRGISYYRNRYDLVEASIQLRANLGNDWQLSYGAFSQVYSSKRAANDERFLLDFANQYPNEFIFGKAFFTGAKADLTWDKRDQIAFPKRGYYFDTDILWQHELGGRNQYHWTGRSSFALYHTFADKLTIADRIGGQAVFGKPYFYQFAQLGGESNLRGYNSKRFAGHTAFYNNLDVRYRLWTINSYIFPATIGVTGFYDLGRVWLKDESSSRWHHGYGGGVFISPGDLFVIQATIGVSREAVLPYIRIGMSF